MDIVTEWKTIQRHFALSFQSNFYVSVASVDENHQPTVTPIGSLFLRDDQTGFYFEKFPTKLPRHQPINPHICVLAVNSNTWFWLKSLFRGRFGTYPAIKLNGQLGERRCATPDEVEKLNRRMNATKGLKGNTYLWSDMPYVRDMVFTKAEKIHLGKMTANL